MAADQASALLSRFSQRGVFELRGGSTPRRWGFWSSTVEPPSSAPANVDATLFAMTLASATVAPVSVRRISALLNLLTMSRRHLRTAPVVLPTSVPIRFGKSYRWPDGGWTHCG